MTGLAEIEYRGYWVWVGPGDETTSIDEFIPDDPLKFGIAINFLLGEKGDPGKDAFDVLVCTPSWFAEQVSSGAWERFRNQTPDDVPAQVAFGRGMWFFQEWSAEDVWKTLNTLLERANPGPDWGVVASRVGRDMPWEYDYRYDDFIDRHYQNLFPPLRRWSDEMPKASDGVPDTSKGP